MIVEYVNTLAILIRKNLHFHILVLYYHFFEILKFLIEIFWIYLYSIAKSSYMQM